MAVNGRWYDCVETFFAEVLDAPFEEIHQSAATPTAQIETRFARPSRHGDMLVLALQIAEVGRRSSRPKRTESYALRSARPGRADRSSAA